MQHLLWISRRPSKMYHIDWSNAGSMLAPLPGATVYYAGPELGECLVFAGCTPLICTRYMLRPPMQYPCVVTTHNAEHVLFALINVVIDVFLFVTPSFHDKTIWLKFAATEDYIDQKIPDARLALTYSLTCALSHSLIHSLPYWHSRTPSLPEQLTKIPNKLHLSPQILLSKRRVPIYSWSD